MHIYIKMRVVADILGDNFKHFSTKNDFTFLEESSLYSLLNSTKIYIYPFIILNEIVL